MKNMILTEKRIKEARKYKIYLYYKYIKNNKDDSNKLIKIAEDILNKEIDYWAKEMKIKKIINDMDEAKEYLLNQLNRLYNRDEYNKLNDWWIIEDLKIIEAKNIY